MKKFYFTLLNLLFVFSAFGMAAEYTEPTYTCDKYAEGTEKEGQDKVFDDFTDTYVETITLTNGDQEKTWNYSAPRVFWNVLSDMTMDAEGGETISAHFVAHSLGAYSESNVLQDLRYTAVVLAVDWDGDGTFEYAGKIKGNTPPTHNVGGNMDVLDFTYDIVVPDDVKAGKARVRFNFTNAWKNGNDETEESYVSRNINSCKEGIVYDFDVNLTPKVIKYFPVNVEDNENVEVVLKDGDTIVKSGTQVEEGKELSVEATPAEGYRVTDIKVNDKSIFSSKKFIVEAESTVTVELEAIRYSVISYTIKGDEANLTKVDLYDGLYSPIANNSKMESGSEYAIYIYPVDISIEVSATLNGEALSLSFDEYEDAWYYEGTADEDQTIVITVPGEGSAVEKATVSYTVVNEDKIEKIELYSDGQPVDNGAELDEGSAYSVNIYPKDASVVITATLNGESIALSYDNLDNVYYYEGTVNGNQTIVISASDDESGLESVSSENVYYNSEEQTLYTDNSKVVVYDLSGRTVLSGEGNVSVSCLEDGVYTAVAGNVVLKFAR